MDYIFHPQTAVELRRLLQQQASSILLSGAEGSGKRTAAFYLSEKLLGKPPVKDIDLHIISPDKKNSISIQAVREIRQRIKLKQTHSNKAQKITRIVIIENAHVLHEEAQNALLKTLEEPPAGTVFILTAIRQRDLLPTVISRVASCDIRPITFEQATSLAPKADSKKITQAYHLSGGNLGLFLAIVNDNTEHELIGSMAIAKELLASSKYQRMLAVDKLQADSLLLQRVLACMKRILEYKLYIAKDVSIARKIECCVQAEKDITAHVNKKLVITDFLAEI